MRLMLGRLAPNLLVDVSDDYNPNNFDFYVVNGYWEGTFKDGVISFKTPSGNEMLEGFNILCSDQKRLCGDYNEVFENYDNVDYIGEGYGKPKPKFDDLDDDIPF